MSELKYSVKVYNKNELITTINVDGENVTFENHPTKKIWQPFGIKEQVSWTDLDAFYKDRSVSNARENIVELLRHLDVDSFDPEYICRKTHGVQFDDFIWLQFSDEPQVTFDDIKLR